MNLQLRIKQKKLNWTAMLKIEAKNDIHEHG